MGMEFKEFAMKGNMMDMAVGIIMGGAFGTVIKSLIEDVIMPVIGHFSGGLNAIIAFAILAWVLFIIIKGMNKAKKAEEEAPAAPPANEVLLAEIRDLLAKK